MTPVRVTGTTDPAEIAAVLAAVSSARARQPQQSAYERWRRAPCRGSAQGAEQRLNPRPNRGIPDVIRRMCAALVLHPHPSVGES